MSKESKMENDAPGVKICSRRDCSSVLDLSYKLKACLICLDKERRKDQNRRAEKKAKNDSIVNADVRACTSCDKILPMEQFASMKGGFQDKILRTCLACRQVNRNQDAKRDQNKTRENNRVQDAKPDRKVNKRQRTEDNHEEVAESSK